MTRTVLFDFDGVISDSWPLAYSVASEHCPGISENEFRKAYEFVTDTLGDAREAEEAGVGVIGVSWGFHNHTTLSKDRAITIVDRPKDLPTVIDAYFA